jgi:hypothetical protein
MKKMRMMKMTNFDGHRCVDLLVADHHHDGDWRHSNQTQRNYDGHDPHDHDLRRTMSARKTSDDRRDHLDAYHRDADDASKGCDCDCGHGGDEKMMMKTTMKMTRNGVIAAQASEIGDDLWEAYIDPTYQVNAIVLPHQY